MAVTGSLEQIRTKVRKITGMLSVNQLTNAELDDYINDFYQYDFPAHLKNWNLKDRLSPILGADTALIPDQAVYPYDINSFTNMEPPIYVGGFEVQLFQDVEAFFNVFPQIMLRSQFSTGTGIAGPYAGTVSNTPILQNGIFISTLDNAGNSLHCTANAAGVFTGDVLAGGTINYTTGAVAGLTWTGVIAIGEPIWAQSITFQAGRPFAVLYFNDELTFFPVPDIAYEVEANVYISPDELANVADEPTVREWWGLIAYGASLKIFGDNLDLDSYAKVDILFDKQKRLVERRTLTQLKNQRTATIYTQSGTNRVPFSSTL